MACSFLSPAEGAYVIRTPKFIVSALLILAMGAYVAFNGKAQKLSKVKTQEEYWADTGLTAQPLEELLQEGSCKSSEHYFLACMNAVLTVAQKYGFDVSHEGHVVPLSKSASQITTEKQLLAPWKAFISTQKTVPAFPFLEVWKELAGKASKKGQLSLAVGVGMNGFLSVFRDPHTYLLPADFYNEVVAKANHKSISVGIVMGRDDKHYFIKKVLENSSAQAAGLKKGDVLVSVGPQRADGLTPYQLGDALKGDEGSTLKMTVLRQGKVQFVSLIRSEKTLPAVSSQVIEGIKPVGVLTINKFAVDTCSQTRATLQSLEMQDIRGLLLDLRDNPGGQMEEAACVVSLFIGPGKKIYQVKSLVDGAEEEPVFGHETQAYKGPVAVLINSGSASASEIVAGALQDYKRAVLVGEKSFGKGSFQEGELWSKNDKVAIFQTKGFYYLPSGRTPQMTGLEPDVKVNFKDRFALREEDQFLNPLRAPSLKDIAAPAAKKATDLSACIDFEEEFLPPEDPEMKEGHRVLNCRNIAEWGQ